MAVQQQIQTWQAKLDSLEAAGDDGAHEVRLHLRRLRSLAGESADPGRVDVDHEVGRWQRALAEREERHSRLGPMDEGWLQSRREIHEIKIHLKRLRSLA